ncbi:hypothetical protein FHR70_003614 [Microvirga lupini]|uniref:Uncharacterized protein n=1 Tax=Microvirga lupini TaxID=420324 RepID=A0A7W4YYZ6_9HYPH|nr:glycosyl hydrolase family 28-related protein [Microvirga lupini]MBB3020528.1 hypothetical protein [Microvirga lupini]
MTTIFVSNLTGNAATNTANIRAAIEQAHQLYLSDPAKAQVKVQLAAGTWVVTGDKSNPSKGAIELPSGVELTGSGTRETVIKLEDNFNARINGIVRTKVETVDKVTVSNLVIDGNRSNNTDHQAGFICGVKEDGSGRVQSNITVDGVEVRNCTAYGINPHEITYNMVIRNSVSHHNGLDGFVADAVHGGVYSNNVAYENDRHGFNIQNETRNLILQNNEAHHNGLRYMFNGALAGGAGITIQRGNILPAGETTIPWVSDIQIIGGSYHHNGKEGILVKLSERINITGVDVYGNDNQGVRIEGAKSVTLAGSRIHDNSQEFDGRYDEVNIRLRLDTEFSQQTYYSVDTRIINNHIFAHGATDARYGIREEPTNAQGGPTMIFVSGNIVSEFSSGAISTSVHRWIGNAASNYRRGTSQDDDLNGRSGNDTIRGLGGNDHVHGDLGNDRLFGGDGKDMVVGGSGNDRLYGGLGNDTLFGEAGRDIFVFNTKLGTSVSDRRVAFDTVVDYSVRADSIWLDNAIFRKLGPGSASKPHKLDADFFNGGNRPKDSDDYINYNRKTGILSYDPDGSGPRKAMEFAQFKKGLALNHHEFFVI